MVDEQTVALIDARRHDAVIFDMDGVVTDSASLHAAAWTELFDDYLSEREPAAGEDHSPFTHTDYLHSVDGKPRYDGVSDFLATRGISLPWGDPFDPPHAETVCALGNRKDRMFLERLTRDGVPVFESTVALVRILRAADIGVAVFSASRNCAQVLEAAGVGDLFPVRVDGVEAENLGLPGKPDPAMLLEATRRLGATPDRTVVVEDAEAGVEAGRRGGFDMVIGIDRAGDGERLRVRGANIVVADLAGTRVHNSFRRMSEIPDALDSWSHIGDLLDTEKTAILLDFDGTLADIVPNPADARLVEGAAEALTDLATRCQVAMVSGRDLEELREHVDLPGLWYAGSHGFELLAPDGTRHVHDAVPGAERALAESADELRGQLSGITGVMVEHKRFAVAVHYRNVAAAHVGTVITAVNDMARQRGLRATGGRKVVELRPDVDWDKGTALRWILDHLTVPALPIYIGDDFTDEDAFDAVESDGLAIVVRHAETGDRRTAARFALADPHHVRDFLDRLAALLRDGESAAASDSWMLTYDGYDPTRERLREALCTVGNGYFATRGAAPESKAGENHYPGTYLAGIYNRLFDEVAGHTIDNESMVNLPNWLPLTFRIDDGDWFDIDGTEILSYRQQLDLRRAVLLRRFRIRDTAGRITTVCQRRLVAMHQPHQCALETTYTAENWSGTLIVRSVLDAAVRNSGVARYHGLSNRHLDHESTAELGPGAVLLGVRTNQSRIAVAMAARTSLRNNGESVEAATEFIDADGLVGHHLGLEVAEGDTVTVEKIVTVFTGRDPAISTPDEEAARWLTATGDFTDLLTGHTAAWEHLWARLRIDLDDQENARRVLRLHLLHLVQTLSPHTADLDVGIPARGLHGEAYRGHVFWDELFVFPVLTPRFPALTRALLHYRYRRLPEARRAAAEAGLRGALFPWQSGSDGREESQRMHLNPLSGRWNPDPSSRARHGGSAVAYSVWQYYQATGDLEFLADRGAEILVEIARCWVSQAEYDPDADRYHLRGVIGPDEFHSGYPDAPGRGIDDNAYTNAMAVWVILRALDALERLAPRTRAQLLESLGVNPSEPQRWEHVSRRMAIPFHDGVISQFAGYEQLAELDWEKYRQRYDSVARLDRILEAEDDDINRYRAGKQADVLMLFYLLSADELRNLLTRLGYDLPPDLIPRTVDYYLARTSHGSTLSALVHAWVLARANRDRAMEFFGSVLDSDIADIQGGTTEEGIHLGAMAGSIDLVQRCLTGLEMRADRIIFNPCWPEALGAMTFPIDYRGHRLTVEVSAVGVVVRADPGKVPPIEIECRGKTAQLFPGQTVRLADADGRV
ncbi:trehalose-phosphatase [Nocardia uniformis]|uniref:Trehalose-phosphatase n=1 Tax=Nocardia uniformis TaxID=53432 RepID=A0A849C755_9NOCA|nr:trehalose-phosphatase [Nocardia uniformis]NNH68811.1 trehalose-phosphatase [Nocardia uniformis]